MGIKKYYSCLLLICISFLFVQKTAAQLYQVHDSMATVIPLTGHFSKLLVSDGVTLVFNQSEDEGLAVSASAADYLNNLEVVIVGDTLKVGLKKFLKIENLAAGYKVYASSSTCTYIHVTNAGRLIILGNLAGDSLDIIGSNAAKIDASLIVKALTLSLLSASLTQLSGQSSQAFIQVKDASKLNGSKLSVENAHLSAKGASKIWLTVNNTCELYGEGASKIYLKGKPNLTKKRLSGLSKLIKFN